jgi:DNA modification methylase
MDCLIGLQNMSDNSIDLMVTSPPYYNAREYSQWQTVNAYMTDMKNIFTELYRTLKNHHYAIINVGDVTCQVGKAKWSVRKLPLGAMFIMMMEDIGFEFIDDYIWDKGEPQSKRHLGNPQYPFYQYPVNCYEHILVFAKHQLDTTKIPCPDCNEIITQSNSCSGIGVQSWECKNPNCPTKSEHGRGKRFSARSIMMNDYQKDENFIDKDFVQKWRRDIVKINPVIKVNCKGENILGHTAPFPEDIPEMAIRYYSGVGDLIVDVFSGSGTTCKVAKQLGRNYLGFEICKEYCYITEKRLKNT